MTKETMDSAMTVGELRKALVGVEDETPVWCHISEQHLEEYMEERLWRVLPWWCMRVVRKHWYARSTGGMLGVAAEAYAHRYPHWPVPWYFALYSWKRTPASDSRQRQLPFATPEATPSGRPQLTAGNGIVMR